MQVTLGLADKIAKELVKQGKDVPQPITELAYAAQKLGLPIIDKVKTASPSHNSAEMNVYPAHIQFAGSPNPMKVNAERAAGVALANQGLIVLFGRDLLQSFIFTYNEPAGEVTISY